MAGLGLMLGLPLSAAALGSCADAGVGTPPPNDRLFFPNGLLLDPRPAPVVSADGTRSWAAPPRWLFVGNANSDLVYNGSTITAIDLDAFFSAWQESPILSSEPAVDDAPPWTDGKRRDADILDIYEEVDEDSPCRRNAAYPQLVECMEQPFITADETVHLGSFVTQLRAYQRPNGAWQVLAPVRADPSVSYVDIGGGLEGDDDLRLSCGVDETSRDGRRCSKEQRMRHLRNNPDYPTIAREPTNLLLTSVTEPVLGADGIVSDHIYDLAFLTHSEVPVVTLLGLGHHRPGETTELDILQGYEGTQPAILDVQSLFSDQAFVGGYGLAERPCTPRRPAAECTAERDTCLSEGGATAVCDEAYSLCVEGNEPAWTLGCTRPLIYAAHRKTEFMLRLTVEKILSGDGTGFHCVTAEELEEGAAGGVLCEHRLVSIDQFAAAGVDSSTSSAGGFGDIAFSRDGNSLYVVRNSVGGLIRVDTSVDERGETRDTPAAQVEVCANPSAMVTFTDAHTEYAAISCYRPATIFIVDLSAFRVIEQVFVGAGPHQMTYDAARSYLYVGNTLEATVSVVDLDARRNTRFTEVARIGLQEPYSG